MHIGRGLVCGFAFLLSAGPVAAAAPFDGSYVGISAEFRGAMRGSGRACGQFARPAPLTIANGHAQAKWGEETLQGDVTPQGTLTMRIGSGGGRFDGQIDAQGVLRGQYNGFCSYNLSWRRR